MLMEIEGRRRSAGAEDPGRQVAARASGRAGGGSKLADVGLRKQLAEGGAAAIAKSDDPMIELARLVDGPSREVRRIYEEQIDEPQRQAYGKIAQARFAIYGDSVYPDATFTLRLAYGKVAGYRKRARSCPPGRRSPAPYEHRPSTAAKIPSSCPRVGSSTRRISI